MLAETLNCPNCGAAASTDASHCKFCESRLATVTCPKCFAMMFIGSRHCQRCGAPAEGVTAANLPVRSCPRCRKEMHALVLGATLVRECAGCEGLWLDVAAFTRICTEREQQSAVLGGASPAPTHTASDAVSKISYVPCPECSQLMNRVNFAKCSGVIVDVCKGHGTWFDRDELTRIVEFIQAGGLEAVRNKEKAELEESRHRFQQEQLDHAAERNTIFGIDHQEHRITGIASAREILKLLLD
jgi:Zn-finger nucleic acid-binding protein